MYKKTLLSLAVASTVGLSGCFSDGGSKNAGATTAPPPTQAEQGTYPIFNPVTSELPLPNDLIFDSDAGDGSLSVDAPAGQEDNPVFNALNNLSGASTVEPAVVQFNGKLEESSIKANETVFLVELKYASGDPVRGLSNQEPPTPVGLADITADLENLDGQSAIRILPTKPLDPLKRYIVVITKGVKDENQQPISQSPAYARLSDNDSGDLGVEGLDTVRGLINGLWEPSVLGLFDSQNIPISEENLALTYSFTTSEDEKVLSHVAEPANWFRDQVRRSVTTAATKQVSGAAQFFQQMQQDGEVTLDPETWDLNGDDVVNAKDFDRNKDGNVTPKDFLLAGDKEFGFNDAQTAVNQAVAAFTPTEEFPNIGSMSTCDGRDDLKKFQCVGNEAKGALETQGAEFPSPEAGTVPEDLALVRTDDALSVSAVLSQLPDLNSGDVNIHQGFVSLPYFLGIPSSDDGSAIRNESWRPDSGLAAVISEATGVSIPQADPGTSKVLNYNFPFMGSGKDVDVPLLAITPGDVEIDSLRNASKDYPVVIFQHGITTDRSAALAFGSQLVKSSKDDLVVVAIDQPLHGVAPASREDQEDLAEELLDGAGQLPGDEEQAEQRIQAVVDREFPEQVLTAIALGLNQFQGNACEEAKFNGLPDGSSGTISDLRTFDEAVANVLAAEECGQTRAQLLGQAFSLDNTVANAGSTIPGLPPVSTESGINEGGVTERHFGYTADAANQPTPMNFSQGEAFGESGSLFINLQNFLNGRDILRQGALDIMNLRASLNSVPALEDSSVYLVGHSLGTQTGGVAAAAIQQSGRDDLELTGVHLMNPVSGIVRLLENSPSFAPDILGGLAAQPPKGPGLRQGDADLETYLRVNQHALDSADPINFAPQLADSNTLLSQVNGDRTTPNAADTRFSSNIKGIMGYDGGPLNIAFPNGLMVDSFEAPLTGSEALAKLMNAQNTGVGSKQSTETPAITRYLKGTHSVPVLPQAESVDAGGVLKDRTIAQSETEIVSSDNAQLVFGELVSQTLQMVQGASVITGGGAANRKGASVIQKD